MWCCFFKQKTAYEMRISDWSSDVCSSDLDPTKEDARNYVASHPDLFRQRKLFAVEQLRMDHPADKAFLKKLKPLKTLGEVQALAAREGIKYHRGKGTLDAIERKRVV